MHQCLYTANVLSQPAYHQPIFKTNRMSNYNPQRQKSPITTNDPLEVELVFNVRPCGTCNFFWPDNPSDQPYGPYSIYDFRTNFPAGNEPKGSPESYPWMKVTTSQQGFPNGEVMDGCRKAPIMTIGINPNMTAFRPGRTGTSWTYPSFTDDNGTSGAAKYAYYYRYRNVYQEEFNFDDIQKYLLTHTSTTVTESGKVTTDQVVAAKSGFVTSAPRPDAAPSFELIIQYEGEEDEIKITLDRPSGANRYVLLFDQNGPTSVFREGDVLAAKLEVPPGEELELYQALQTYYEQFVPSLDLFSTYLQGKGYHDANLKIGEDVGQLDMVACASPHWNPGFLGGTQDSENTIIHNCVTKNAWAMKQLVMTRPAVLFLVGESSYSMFKKAFGKFIDRSPALPGYPEDFAFTLFKATADSSNPTYFKYETEINGRPYKIKTRLIVTPHFSYDSNFVPQFRLDSTTLRDLSIDQPDTFNYLSTHYGISFTKGTFGFNTFTFSKDDVEEITSTLKNKYPAAWKVLEACYYYPHQMMAQILEDMFEQGGLSYTGNVKKRPGFLTRGAGSCHFCVNDHWSFPAGCPYGKNEEQAPPAGFLSQVATQIAKDGSLS